MSSPADTDRVYERFHLIVNGPALFNALVAGLELDVFGYLSRNPESTFEDLEHFTKIPPHKLRVLMLALCATELIERHDGKYSNSAAAEDLLGEDGPDSWRQTLIGWQRVQYPGFPYTTSALRTGTNTALSEYEGTEPTLYQRLGRDPELEAVFHASMASFTMATMEGLLGNAELASVGHLLDIGGGDGTTAMRFAERHPAAKVTVFDQPSVKDLAGRTTLAPGTDRVAFYGGNMFDDDFPRGADAILFSHVLEIFSAEQIVFLLSKAFDALPAGGKVFIYGFNASDDEQGGVYAARLSLYMNVLATGNGMAYPRKDFETWLRQAGSGDVKSYPGLPYEHGLIMGVKK